jgi:DNA mismatch repair ATPase MutL
MGFASCLSSSQDAIQTKVRDEEKEFFEEHPVHIWGFVGAPGVARSSRTDQHLFVNQRPIENRALNFALMEAYHTSLMKGKFPVCCLFFELSPAFVDVNVHPSKKEIRFHNEYAVKQCAVRAVKRTLLHFAMGSSNPAFREAQLYNRHKTRNQSTPTQTSTATHNTSLPPSVETPSHQAPSMPKSEVMSLPTFDAMPPRSSETAQPGSFRIKAQSGSRKPIASDWKSRTHQATDIEVPTNPRSNADSFDFRKHWNPNRLACRSHENHWCAG